MNLDNPLVNMQSMVGWNRGRTDENERLQKHIPSLMQGANLCLPILYESGGTRL